MGTYPQNPDLHNVVGMNFHHIHKLTKNYPSANVSNEIITVNTITEIAMSINNKANKWHCCVRLTEKFISDTQTLHKGHLTEEGRRDSLRETTLVHCKMHL